jgi:arylsulfatase A-like enzyme
VRRVSAQVRLVDVMPTVLDLLGLPPAADREGRSLVPLLQGEESAPRLAWAEIPHHALIDEGVRWAVRTGTHKLIVTPPPERGRGEPRLELYALEEDAGERTNLASRDPQRRAELMQQLRGVALALNQRGAAVYREVGPPDPKLEERLRSLGYVE